MGPDPGHNHDRECKASSMGEKPEIHAGNRGTRNELADCGKESETKESEIKKSACAGKKSDARIEE